MTLFNLKNNRFAKKSKKENKNSNKNSLFWVSELDTEHYELLKSDIVKGMTVNYILSKMNSLGYWEGLTFGGAQKRIQKLYQSIIRPEILSSGSYASRTRVRTRVDVIGDLERLIIEQKTRLKKMRDKEQQTPLLLEQVSKESDILANLLTKLGKLQMDMGILKKADVQRKGSIVVDPTNPNMMSYKTTEHLISKLDELDKELE